MLHKASQDSQRSIGTKLIEGVEHLAYFFQWTSTTSIELTSLWSARTNLAGIGIALC